MRITRRQLQVSLGALWVLDGLLQCQPYMFSSGFARQMLVPALQGVPAVVASPLHPLVTLVLAHPVLANAFFATVQILLGVALLVRHHTRVVLSVSIAWALSVWVVGEGLGGLTTGSTMLSGAPGAALLYAVIAILAWPSRQHGDQESPSWWALPAWSLLWLSGAGLQLVSGNNSAMSFTMMLRSAQNGSPRWISDIDHRLQVLRAPTWIVAVIVAIFVLVALWSLVPGWTRHLALGAFGLTESDAGTDAGGTRTSAQLEDGQWVINGSKSFITNSGTNLTKLVTLTAVTGEDERGRKGISSFLVEVPTPGFIVEPAYDKVGWHASDTHPLTFNDLRVPEENLLGELNRGYANFLHILDEGRIAIAALAVGAAQGCVDESVKYANQREAFGRPIGRNQAISFMIADMEARTHTARCAYYDAAARMLSGRPFKKEAAIAKLVASNAAMDNARDATQIHGGYGFMNECPVARHYRDSKILEIGEGTSEVQKMLIARMIGV